MPQLTLTDGELVKKTLRTTLVMLGTTAIWLGGLTGAVMMTTSPSSSGAGAEAKTEKASPMGSAGTKVPMSVPARRVHPASAGPSHADPAHTGDPI